VHRVECEWDTLHMWVSHITRMNNSYHTREWSIRLSWRSHVTLLLYIHMNESSHVTHVNGSRHTCEWVTSHVWMNTSHTWMRDITHMNASHQTHECVMCLMRRIHVMSRIHCVWCDAFMRRIHMWMRDITWVRRIKHMNVSHHICRRLSAPHHAPRFAVKEPCCIMNESRHAHEPVTAHMNESCHICRQISAEHRALRFPVDELCHTHEWVTSHIWTSHVTLEWVMTRIQVTFCRASRATISRRQCTESCVHVWAVLRESLLPYSCARLPHTGVAVCCSMLWCGVVCCSVLCCSALQYAGRATRVSALLFMHLSLAYKCCGVLQYVAMCYSVLQWVAVGKYMYIHVYVQVYIFVYINIFIYIYTYTCK